MERNGNKRPRLTRRELALRIWVLIVISGRIAVPVTMLVHRTIPSLLSESIQVQLDDGTVITLALLWDARGAPWPTLLYNPRSRVEIESERGGESLGDQPANNLQVTVEQLIPAALDRVENAINASGMKRLIDAWQSSLVSPTARWSHLIANDLVIWLILAGLIVLAADVIRSLGKVGRFERGQRRLTKGNCPECGYVLFFDRNEHRCSECGFVHAIKVKE